MSSSWEVKVNPLVGCEQFEQTMRLQDMGGRCVKTLSARPWSRHVVTDLTRQSALLPQAHWPETLPWYADL